MLSRVAKVWVDGGYSGKLIGWAQHHLQLAVEVGFQDHWRKAIAAAGIPGLHFHDLRHTGNTWAAETGATLRDLMDRMGHSTTRAALIYLHKTAGRDRKIADALSKLVEDSRGATAKNAAHVDDQGDTDPAAGGTDGHADREGHAGGTTPDQ